MKEIEILTEVFDRRNKVLKILKPFKFVGAKKTSDVYFYDPKRKNLQSDRYGRLNECLRLRRKEDKTFLAYKIDHFDRRGIWLYSDEHETEANDFQKMLAILKHLGLKVLVEIENKKHIFLTKNYEIVFEEVKGLGLFLEVECLKEPANIKKAKKDIWTFIKSLGLKTGEELNVGKPELMLRKKPRKMGGRIWAESAGKGKGAKFSFSLPMADRSRAKKVGS